MITDLVVYLSFGFTVVFVAAWALRPDLRAWIERPKYLFLENVRRYDQEAHPNEQETNPNEQTRDPDEPR